MGDKKKDLIEKYKSEGLSNEEIAEEVGTSIQYVNKILEGEKYKPEDEENLGSEMEVLYKIIKEVSRTSKGKSVVRLFSRRDPDDLEYLTELFNRADIPVSDIWLIVQNWAEHRHILPSPELQEHIERLRKGVKEKDSSDDITVEVDKIRKERVMKMKQEMAMLEMEDELKRLKNKSKDEVEKKAVSTRVRYVPRIDTKTGDMMADKEGNPVLERIEETGIEINSSSSIDPMMMLLMMNLKKPEESSNKLLEVFIPLLPDILAVLKPSDEGNTKDLDIKLELVRKDMEKQREIDRSNHELQMQKITSALEMKNSQDVMGGYIGQLRDEIKDMKSQSGLDNDKFEINTKKQIYDGTVEKVSKGIDGLSSDVKDVAKNIVGDLAEERKHRRYLERLSAGSSQGLSPAEVQAKWESNRVPNVSDEDLVKEMAQQQAAKEE